MTDSYPPSSPILLRSRLPSNWKPFKNGITSLTISIPQPSASKVRNPPIEEIETKSRWKTREFYAYYGVFAIAVPYMAKVVVDLSKESHPNYRLFEDRLKNGWIFGWKIDSSDHQWYVFRNNLPLLGGLVLIWMLASRIYLGSRPYLEPSSTPQVEEVIKPREAVAVEKRINFILAFAIPLLIFLHGTSIIKILILLGINYGAAKLITKLDRNSQLIKFIPILTWGLNIGLLFANELYDGYYFANLSSLLAFLDSESLKGIKPRWHINFNITMLRLVSFNMDYYWAFTASPSTTFDETSTAKFTANLPELTERARTTTSHPLALYSFKTYLAYALYPPLYLAGPILTFNAFQSQLLSPPNISFAQIRSYLIRFVICLLTMELVLSSMYVVAIKDNSRRGAWEGDTPFELSMIGFWNLIVVWLKLLIPWRFFRLWSLLDGIDPPENMVRCMANNYSTLGFWRSWHRSYNLWVVRYLYIPLGGAKHAILATLAVFTFVALWHDLSLKLLTWGWVISLFVLPEMGAKALLPSKTFGGKWWYRHVAALGGVVNILMMMTANLIGFAIGTEGMGYMWSKMIGSYEGWKFMIVASVCLFVAVQVMFEYREEEQRKGIVRRC